MRASTVPVAVAVAIAVVSVWAALGFAAPASVSVDWSRGLVIGHGVGLADRHAPNPAVARGTSRRAAEDAARAQLAIKLGELPIAGGGKVADRVVQPNVKARLAAAVAHAVTLTAEPQTDGAWRVTMAVPIEAVRQALTGVRQLESPGSEDRGPQVIIVEGVRARPAVGWTVAGIAAPTLWVDSVPAWAKDAPRVTAQGARDGAIDVAGIDATAATLFVLVARP
jgi:hypothetical protein